MKGERGIMVKVVKLKVVKPINIDWQTFGKIINDVDYINQKIKNKAVTSYHMYKQKEFAWNQANPENKINAENLKEMYGHASYKSIIGNAILPEFKTYGIYSGILDTMVKDAIDVYKKNQGQIFKGNISVPSFKRQLPFTMSGREIKIIDKNTVQMPFLSLLGRKLYNLKNGRIELGIASKKGHAKIVMERLISGRYKKCDSQLQRKGKNVFILLCFKDTEIKQVAIDKNKYLGIDLGITQAATMAVENEPQFEFITGGEIERFRHKVNKKRQSMQNQLKHCSDNRKGHGKETLLRPIKNLGNKIEKFKDTTNHRYSKFIVEYAIKYGCGTIQMEKLKNIRKNDNFLAKWSYYDLQQKIEYKANEVGIDVKYVEPKYTSQRCHCCGVIDKGNRITQEKFECQTCGHKTNADLNAARNIATKGIELIINEQLKSQEKIKKKSVHII